MHIYIVCLLICIIIISVDLDYGISFNLDKKNEHYVKGSGIRYHTMMEKKTNG